MGSQATTYQAAQSHVAYLEQADSCVPDGGVRMHECQQT